MDGKAAEGTPDTASGDYWMHAGVQLEMKGDFQAAMFTLER
jgi:alpha-galactosidase